MSILPLSAQAKEPAPPVEDSVSVQPVANELEVDELDKRPRSNPFPVVGIGASAGGLEAFSELLSALPVDTGMAFVLIQHLDPTHPSLLASLLAKTTAMPVTEVRDGARIEPNHVYVIPPNSRMTIGNGALHLAPRPGRTAFYPVDHFFMSLADQQRRLSIGVILSGTASDGSKGVRAIKAHSGITFAQDEESAQQAGMPHMAHRTGAIDYVLPPAAIARELARISHHPLLLTDGGAETMEALPQSDADLRKIFLLLERTKHVDFSQYKQTTVRRRLGRRMLVHRCETLAEYLNVLQHNPEEVQELYNDILICVTAFFRDPAAFAAITPHLEKLVIRTADHDTLRVWVPGCATGEEVYSLAICFREILNQQGRQIGLQFFGTDINELALQGARRGIYSDHQTQFISPERMLQFFNKVDGGYQINKQIRDSCIFAMQDVTRDPPFARLDVISCRNLLIYLGPALQTRVLNLFHYALNHDGLLFLGSAESASTDLFSALEGESNLFAPNVVSAAIRPTFSSYRHPTDPVSRANQVRALNSVELQRRADRAIQSRYAPDGVVIDAGMHILQFRGQTGFYLEPAPGAASDQLLRMARPGLQPILRKSILAAIERNTLVQEKGVHVEYGGETREITLEVVPIAGSGPSDRYYLVMFERVGLQRQSPPEAPALANAPEPMEARVERLERELADAREYLSSETEDHETAIEELRAASEEVSSANEELLSTNAQLATAKEELQSINEELTTLNEELQSRNDELGVLSNDLNNVLNAVKLPILMVDRGLRLRRYTPAAETWLGLFASDVGRPLSGFEDRLPLLELTAIVTRVIESLTMETRELKDAHGSWWQLNVHPYRTSEHRIEGAVLSFVDIDPLQRNLDGARDAKEFSEAIVNTVSEPLLVLSPDLRIMRTNPAFHHMFQTSPADTDGRLLFEMEGGQWDVEPLHHALEELLPRDRGFAGLELQHAFPRIGLKTMRLNGCRIARKDGSAQTILLAIEDITSWRNAEQGLLRSNANLERFAHVVSHDLREPLRTIHSFTDLLAKFYPSQLNPEADEYVAFVEDGVKRMDAMITDLLTYSQVSTLDSDGLQKISAKAALQDSLWSLQAAIHGSKAIVTQDELPSVNYRKSQLTQLFLNLIANSLKYCRPEEAPRVHVSAERVGSEWIFAVRDNGMGFEYKDAESIFEVFKRLHGRQYPGTGIGLATCKRIVERHGGRIWAESEVGVGSTFRFSVTI